MKQRSIEVFLVFLLGVVGAPATALELGGHDRDGLVIGLNVGPGWSKYSFDLAGKEVTTEAELATSGNLSLGWARSDALMASFTVAGWSKTFNQNTTPVMIRNFHLLADVSWFPAGQGAWIKAGFGLAEVRIDVRDPADPQALSKSGPTYLLGAGWELRIDDDFAIGIGYDVRGFGIDDFGVFGDTSGLTHTVGLNLRYYASD
jgi:opacity protein-like surface antigen